MSQTKIEWQSWSAESLERANREEKPVLLAITATWCHWCHVMEQTTFGHDEVAAYVNSHFVPIRADNDRRPDLNSRYNMGGWPTVAFLLPGGEILTGATYLPPRQLLDMMALVADTYARDREGLARRAAELLAEQQESVSSPGREIDQSVYDDTLRSVESVFDALHGGFGIEPKFPHVPALEMLLLDYQRTGNPRHLEIAARTLRAMGEGGVFDTEEGGFFRYSTTRDWSVPHYEKMLEDNSLLLGVYMEAYSITRDDFFKHIADEITRYLETVLLDPKTGAFFGSQDADEEYYKLGMEERTKRDAPSVDRAIYANWNGMAADACLRAYQLTNEQNYLDRALGAIAFVTENMRDGGMFFHYYESEPGGAGILSDQIWMGTALLRAFEVTGEREYLELARISGDAIITRFSDAVGGFFDITEERRTVEKLPQREKSIDEAAYASRFLTRLAAKAGHDPYRDAADRALRAFARAYSAYGLQAAAYATAVREGLEVGGFG